MMEKLLADTFGDREDVSTDYVESTHDLRDIDPGIVGSESPHFAINTEEIRYGDCGFRYTVETVKEGLCPVCR